MSRSDIEEQIRWWRDNGFDPWEALRALGYQPDPLGEPTWTEVAAAMPLALKYAAADRRRRIDAAEAEVVPCREVA